MWSAVTAPPGHFDGHQVTEFRAWARRAWWAAHATPRQKARALALLLLTPWRFAKQASRELRRYGPFVSRQFGVSRSRQLAGLISARVRYGLDPIAYYRFQLFRPERWTRASRYLQTADTGRVLRWLVAETPGYASAFGDKRVFERWCADHGFPPVGTLVELEGGRVVRTLAPDGALPAADLFSKPSNAQGGDETGLWVHRADGRYAAADGRVFDAAGLVAELAVASVRLGRPILLQRALRNAARDRPLSPGGLCTARITTMKQPDGRAELLFAIYRMPVDATVAADNFACGGLAAPIDPATGRLGPAVRKVSLLHEAASVHPQTGARIEGHELSHWADAVSLVLRAHEAIDWKGVPVIGWDVALLEDGPVLVEGNNVPCSTFAQMVLDAPLGDSPLVACINAHLRECFARSSAHD